MRSYRWLLFALAAFTLALDLSSKYGMFSWLYTEGSLQGNREVIPGWFRFTAEYDPSAPLCECGFKSLQTLNAPVMPRVNHGALFGLGSNHKGSANQIFAAISLIAALGIIGWGLLRGKKADGWLCTALGMILGGTLGNFYDRVVFNGVRDFLYFYKVEWPVFNIADCCLVCGAGLLLVQSFFASKPKTPDDPVVATPEKTNA